MGSPAENMHAQPHTRKDRLRHPVCSQGFGTTLNLMKEAASDMLAPLAHETGPPPHLPLFKFLKPQTG